MSAPAKIGDYLRLRRSRHSRHTTATHLLRAGVDINTVRAWLAHVSVDTTTIYAETDLETKARALAACELGPDSKKRGRRWKDDHGHGLPEKFINVLRTIHLIAFSDEMDCAADLHAVRPPRMKRPVAISLPGH